TLSIAMAIPVASLCINRRLYKIASCSSVSVSKAEKRRAVLVDLTIGLGIPLIQMSLRAFSLLFTLNIGSYNVVPAYPFSYLCPNIFNLIYACYAVLTLREFLYCSAQFALLLSSSAWSSALSMSRYFRLMSLTTIELVHSTSISAYGLYLSITHDQIRPRVSWANTHFDFGTIDVFPMLFWRADAATVMALELSGWAVVFCVFVFFAFFGFAAEVRKHYRLVLWADPRPLQMAPSRTSASRGRSRSPPPPPRPPSAPAVPSLSPSLSLSHP
ncbi:pheromone A receptor-domain-containing protein, partial [Mycena leptocephala]